MAQQDLTLLDMENRLAEDTEGTYLKELREQIGADAAEVKRALDAGLAPDDFQAVSKLKTSIDAAEAVVGKVWQRMHPENK